MTRLVLPHRMFDELAAGCGGSEAGRFLASAARGRHLLLLRAVADEAGTGSVRDSFRALAALYETAPDRVDPVLRYPAVGAWALATLRSLREGRKARPERMAALAAAAAVRADTPFEIRVPADEDGVMLPSLGRVLSREPAPGPGATRSGAAERGREPEWWPVHVEPAGAWAEGDHGRVDIPADPTRDAPGWQGLRTITAGHPDGPLRLVVDDLDPYRFPPGDIQASRLSEAEVAAWTALFQDAWTILRTHHAAMADEIRTLLSVVTPLSPSGWPTSGTSRTTFGCVALARPGDPLSLAATLVHEAQHAKLSELFHLVDLVSPDAEARYYAPWRHDARPITGLLHGTYAHLGVADFWRRQRHVSGGEAAHAEFVRWREAAADTARVIRGTSALTPVGHRFVDGMVRTLDTLRAEPAPDEAAELANRAAEEHRRRYGRWSRPRRV